MIPKKIELALKILPIPFYTAFLQGINITISMLMIVVGKPVFAFIPQLLQMILLCAGCYIFAAASKDNITNIMYVYNISDLSVFVLYLIFIFIPIKEIKKKLYDVGSSVSMQGIP